MSKRPSRGVSSGIGSPTKMTGRDGDLTIRKTKEGKILYVKEHGSWHPINTGVDTAKLKKDVDRLIRSVNTLRSDNNPFPTINSLNIRKNVATATVDPKITFTIAGSDKYVLGVDDNDSGKFVISSGGTLGTANRFAMTSGGDIDTTGHMDIGVTKAYSINGTSVLNTTTLGGDVVNSSLTSIGTLTGLTTTKTFPHTLVDDGTYSIIDINGTVNSASGSGRTINAIDLTLTETAVTGYTVNFFDMKVDTTSKLKVSSAGAITSTGIAAGDEEDTPSNTRYLMMDASTGLIGYRTAADIKSDSALAGASGSFTSLTVDGTDGISVKNGSTGPGFIKFFEDSDNGTNAITLIGPASTADATLTLPTTAGTLALTSQIPTNYITNDAADIMSVSDFGANAALKIVAAQPATAGAEDSTGLHIDYDRTVAGSGTAAHNDVGIDLDMNTASLGTSLTTGLDIDIVGAATGTHSIVGLDINVSGAGANNKGMVLTASGTGARQFTFKYDEDNVAEVFINGSGQMNFTAAGASSSSIQMTADTCNIATDSATIASVLEIDETGSGGSRLSVLRLKGTQPPYGGDYRHFYIATGNDSSTKIYNDANDPATHAADIEIEATKDIILDAVSDVIIDPGSGITHFRDAGDTDDAFKITVVGGTGATTLETVSAAADGHLSVVADGHVEFDNCAVGFDKLAGTFSTSGVIGDGNDSTDIDFRLSNKYELELTNNISGTGEFINLIFPATSGNFLLVISQDNSGSRTIASAGWVVYQSDGGTKATNAAFADGTDGDVRWAGGSAPTLTTTEDKADIISFYWDADNQTCFGTASLNF